MAQRRSPPLSFSRSLFLLLSASTVYATSTDDWKQRRILKRSNTVTDPTALSGNTFDYVIVGGGTAGLVLAGRLSENSSVTVAVIEAGADGSEVQDQILAPALAYTNGIASATSPYDWHYSTVNQTGLVDASGGERTVYWPRGKVLGGSSAVNGLYMCRGSEIEHNSWASLNPGSNSSWGWDAIYPAQKTSENWTAPSAANIALANMTLDQSLHGLSGPIHYSYPGFFYPQVAPFLESLLALGIPQRDPAGGETWGAMVATSAIDPDGWTRSYSKTGYLDPAASRTNLVVLTGYQATKIIFDNTTATGVSFAASVGATSYTVSASQEVILAAGVIGSPQLLQVSGVGSSALLTPLGIAVVSDLPGVGMHLTDHLSSALVFDATGKVEFTGDPLETNTTYAAEQLTLWKAGDASSLVNSPNDAIAYVDLVTLMGATAAADLITTIKGEQAAQVAAYSTDPTVQAGYNAVYTAEVDDIYPSLVGQAEILMSNTGTYGAYPNLSTISIQAAIQHGLSRGSVKINSTSTFDAPLIDPGYLTHPSDITILVAAFKFARTLSQTAPLSSILVTELSPGSAVSTDAEWEAWLRAHLSTEYHPAGTASMLPLEKGGVVDPEMRVYGTSNLRVVDASIVPIGLTAHMTAPLYAVSERAYEILVGSSSSSLSSSTSSSSTTKTSTTSKASTSSKTSTSSASSPTKSTGAGGRTMVPLSTLGGLLTLLISSLW